MTTSPLLTMTQTTPTALWNDSSALELTNAIGGGAVGATYGPVIALAAIRSDLPRWQARIAQIAADRPTAAESQIGWQVVGGLDRGGQVPRASVRRARRPQRPAVDADRPRLHRDAAALADQAEHFSSLAPNIIVKIPATGVGIKAIEEATYRGVSVSVTVSITVPQAVEAGAAIQRGLDRRKAENKETASMGPVVTIMVGRLDDWMKTVVERDGIEIDPEHLEWAGVAAFKKAYEVFLERGFQARVLAAALRNQLQWTELVGGDIVLSAALRLAGEIPGQRARARGADRRAGRPEHHRRAADHPRLRARLRGRRDDGRRVRRLRRRPHHAAPVPRGRRGPRPDRARRDRPRS